MKLRKSKLTAEQIVDMYVVQLMTMEDIGVQAGITRQAVKGVLDKMNVEYRGGKVPKVCLHCGKEFKTTRKQVNKGTGNYCSNQCFHASRANDVYIKNRQGQRIARKVMNATGEQVVHHIDGDNTNNDPSNLMLFESNSAHMKHHHSLRK